MFSHPIRRVISVLLLACIPIAARAGGGPANVVVVVNADSWASLTVANEFVALRGIPAANVVCLHDLPEWDETDVETFRERILKPVLRAVRDRGLGAQMDYLVYSADIPYRVNVSTDLGEHKVHHLAAPWASVNGLTYLAAYVLGKNPAGYLDLDANRYARRPLPELQAYQLSPEQMRGFAAAIELMRSDKWAEATAVLQKLLEEAPRAAEPMHALAECLARQGQADEAMRLLLQLPDLGYLDVSRLLESKGFEGLRSRPEFQALVQRMSERVFDVQPTHGFRSAYAWGADGTPGPGEGPHYMLSMMLGVTTGRDGSVTEALSCLRRAAAADGTRPPGTIYYPENHNIRSRVRQWGFRAAAAKLRELGVAAEVLPGDLPTNKSDVMGAMIGSAGFSWAASGSTILPGAICEHLTSLGGVLAEGQDGGQTPLTELIRHGAAGASGTVTEPFAIQAKFPDPFIHVHYARGCSLAEAFYQSVRGPYQLLIVGDPLCRPWATIPKVTVQGLEPNEVVKGRLSLRPDVTNEPPVSLSHFELFMDGRRQAVVKPQSTIGVDTQNLADGYHELRLVAVAAGDIETQGEVVVPFFVENDGRRLELTGLDGPEVRWGAALKLGMKLPGASSITLFFNREALATVEGDTGEAVVDTRRLGLGPVRLHAVATIGTAAYGVHVSSAPLSLRVLPPPPLKPVEVPGGPGGPRGLTLTRADGTTVTVASTAPGDWLAKAGVQPGQQFTLSGYTDVPADDIYQVQAQTDGEVTVAVDGTELGRQSGGKWAAMPVHLAAGSHQLTIQGTAGPSARAVLRFGPPGARHLSEACFRCPSEPPPGARGAGILTALACALLLLACGLWRWRYGPAAGIGNPTRKAERHQPSDGDLLRCTRTFSRS